MHINQPWAYQVAVRLDAFSSIGARQGNPVRGKGSRGGPCSRCLLMVDQPGCGKTLEPQGPSRPGWSSQQVPPGLLLALHPLSLGHVSDVTFHKITTYVKTEV